MTDSVTIAAAVAGAIASKEVLGKFLGPTAEYLGEGLRNRVQRSADNFNRVVAAAISRTKGWLETPGTVNPRVFKSIWDESRFTEDVLVAEYFGGLLASARTPDGKDDSAVGFVALIKSLSAHEVRVHFVTYYLICRNLKSSSTDERRTWNNRWLIIPTQELIESLASSTEIGSCDLLAALRGLADHGLISTEFAFRNSDLTESTGPRFPDDDSVVLRASAKGVRLFLRAMGLRGLSPEVIESLVPESIVSEDRIREIRIPERSEYHRWKRLGTAGPVDITTSQDVEVLSSHVSDTQSSVDDLEARADDLESRVTEIERRLDKDDGDEMRE